MPLTACVNYQFQTGNDVVDGLIAHARRARQAAHIAEQRAQQATHAALNELARHADLSNRDIAVLLGLSHQRIGQLRRESHTG